MEIETLKVVSLSDVIDTDHPELDADVWVNIEK